MYQSTTTAVLRGTFGESFYKLVGTLTAKIHDETTTSPTTTTADVPSRERKEICAVDCRSWQEKYS